MIEAAVLETTRGRWFLAEYARRNRTADTMMLLAALDRIEGALRGERSVQSVDRIRFDLVEMAKAIARTKAEIAAIKPDAEHHGKFGDATEELDAIVQATETATSDILASAEQIQEIAWTMREQGFDGEVCDLLDSKATDVYTSVLVPGPHRPAHPQGDPGAALPGRPHQRDDRHLGARRRDGGGSRRGRAGARATRRCSTVRRCRARASTRATSTW